MNTHHLIWNQSANAMRVCTVEWFLSRCRDAYADNRPMGWVPIATGQCHDMHAALSACKPTIAKRASERQPEEFA